MTFYDCYGVPVAYTEDNETIYLFTGEPVAYFYENAVYSFSGIHLGWFENGWIRDLFGASVFYTENATGSGPVKPVRCVRPVKGVKYVKPVKCVREIKRVKAVNTLSWSRLSGTSFFQK